MKHFTIFDNKMLQRTTMNTQTKLSASRLIVITLACFMAVCLVGYGGDDDELTVGA